VAALAALDKHELAEMPKLLAVRAAAERKRELALEALQIAQDQFNRSFVACQDLSVRSNQAREKHKAALEQSASPKIDAFLARLESETVRLRRESPTTRESRSKELRTFGARLVESNFQKLGDRIRAIVAARDQVRAFKYEIIDDTRLEQRLNEVWDSLPDTAL
jgi:hypothetical protein